jgi:hypothetical protein
VWSLPQPAFLSGADVILFQCEHLFGPRHMVLAPFAEHAIHVI